MVEMKVALIYEVKNDEKQKTIATAGDEFPAPLIKKLKKHKILIVINDFLNFLDEGCGETNTIVDKKKISKNNVSKIVKI